MKVAVTTMTSANPSIVADAGEPLIEIARATLRDLRQAEADSLPLTLDSTLDQDLGLDSLARVELFTRIEHDLRVRLPDSLFETAETLRDIAIVLGLSESGVRSLIARALECLRNHPELLP